MGKAFEELIKNDEETEDFTEEIEAAKKMECPHCSGKVIFSATGFYCASCKRRVG